MFEKTNLFNSELKFHQKVSAKEFSTSKSMTDLVSAFKIAENISCLEYHDGTIFINISFNDSWLVLSNKKMTLVEDFDSYLIEVD